MLRKRAAQCMIEVGNETAEVKFEVTHSLAGGYALRSPLCKNPESSPEPLLIYSIFKASAQDFDVAYDVFFDYIHEDIKNMTRIDMDFNIFQRLILQYRDQDQRLKQKKFILEEILNNKSRMHSEIMNSIKNRQLIATELLMRVRDFDSSKSSAHRYASRSGESTYGNLGGEEEEKYEYIPVRKVYIFHFVEKLMNNEVNFISYSPSSL